MSEIGELGPEAENCIKKQRMISIPTSKMHSCTAVTALVKFALVELCLVR